MQNKRKIIWINIIQFERLFTEYETTIQMEYSTSQWITYSCFNIRIWFVLDRRTQCFHYWLIFYCRELFNNVYRSPSVEFSDLCPTEHFSNNGFVFRFQEVLFNLLACVGYMSAASYMAWTTMIWLYPRFVTTRGYMGYPMMTVVYVSNTFHLPGRSETNAQCNCTVRRLFGGIRARSGRTRRLPGLPRDGPIDE